MGLSHRDLPMMNAERAKHGFPPLIIENGELKVDLTCQENTTETSPNEPKTE